MTTATKTSPLAELEQLEAAQAEADRAATEAEEEYGRVVQRARELVEQRQNAATRDPELVDHQGKPTSKTNAIAKIDTEIADLGDWNDLGRRACA